MITVSVWVTLRHAHVHTPVGVCIGVVSVLTMKTTTSSAVVKQERARLQGNVFVKLVYLCIIFLDYIKMWQLCVAQHEAVANSTNF